MLHFSVFVDTQSRRSLDFFPGLDLIPCPRFPKPLVCHTSENSPVSEHPIRMRVPSDHRESRDLTRALNPLAATLAENHLVSPAIATDPKTHLSNPCICHTSETPGDLSFWFNRLVTACRFNFRSLPFMGHSSRVTVHFPVSPFFSDSSALFPTTAIAYLLFIQSVAHSFHRNGGCTPLPTSFDIQTFRGFDVFTISPKVLYFQYHERRI